jgi:hypothetical protein
MYGRPRQPPPRPSPRPGRDLSDAERWPYRLHDLCHYSATELLDVGLSIVTVKNFLGHAKASTASDIDGHGGEHDAEKVTAILDAPPPPSDDDFDAEYAEWEAERKRRQREEADRRKRNKLEQVGP